MRYLDHKVRNVLGALLAAVMLPSELSAAVCTAGFNNPTANAADTGGDGDGYGSNPTKAYTINNSYALDKDSGKTTVTSCGDAGKDRHRFSGYGFNLPPGASIEGIELQLMAKVDDTPGDPRICAEFSWNGGANWTSAVQSNVLSKTNKSYILGSPTNTWGRTWTAADFNSNTKFQVRLTNVASDILRDFSLDYVGVKVTCTLPEVSFNSASSSGSESLGLSYIPVSLSAVSTQAVSTQTVTVNWVVANNTDTNAATIYNDFSMADSVGASGSLTFLPGETMKIIRVLSKPDGPDGNGIMRDETVKLQLSIPVNGNAALGSSTLHTFTIYDAPPRNVSGDFWADIVLGQREVTEATTNKVVSNQVFNPGGVVVDRGSPSRSTGTYGRAYVWDSGNSRILGFDLDTCQGQACSPALVNGVPLVFGQPSGEDFGACNRDASLSRYPYLAPASASTLCGIPAWYVSPKEKPRSVGMAVDKATGDLYVPDYENNRVLIFKNPYTDSTPTIADDVIGQDDFSGVYCNKTQSARRAMGGNGDGQFDPFPPPTDSSLCSMSNDNSSGFGVALDASGNLWVADGGNNRVLQFPKDPVTGRIAKTASIKLNNFLVNGSSTLDTMKGPSSLAFGQGGKLYIADAGNNADSLAKRRVLVLTPPFSNGMAATKFKDLTNNTNNSDDIHLAFISTLDDTSLSTQSGLWISAFFPQSGDSRELRQYDWNGNLIRTLKLAVGTPNFEGPADVDKVGNVLVPGGRDINDVLVYKPSDIDKPDSLLPPRSSYNSYTGDRLISPLGIATANNQLFVADGYRILIWNNLDQLSNGKPADSIIGQGDFDTQDYIFNDDRQYTQMKVDGSNRLWVAARDRIFVYDTTTSIYTWSKPAKVIQGPFPVLGGGGTVDSLSPNRREIGLVPMVINNKEFLWVAQPFMNRVLRIRNPLNDPNDPLVSNRPTVDIVLGQENLSGYCCNRAPLGNDGSGNQVCALNSGVTNFNPNLAPPIKGRDFDRLCYPYNLSIDRNDLYLSDHMTEGAGNMRLLRFNTADTTKFPTDNPSVIFGPLVGATMAANKEFPQATFETAFHTTAGNPPINRMVTGFDSYGGHSTFVGVYENPNGVTAPTSYLKDHTLRAAAITFDQLGNLYVADTNHAKVFVYKQPFVSIAGNQTPVYPSMQWKKSQVVAESDAAYTCGTTTINNSSTVLLGKCLDLTTDSVAGLRFNGINIPSSATIVNAVIIFMPTGLSPFTNPLTVNISGVGQLNPSTFSGNLSLLPRINDSSTGQPIPFNDSDNGPWDKKHWHATPNLKNIVQQIIGQDGWVSGNSMAFLILNDGTPDPTPEIRAMYGKYQLDRDFSPILYIQYY